MPRRKRRVFHFPEAARAKPSASGRAQSFGALFNIRE
jgi:hypothetical protein